MQSMTIDEFLSLYPADLRTVFQYTDRDERRHYECLLTTDVTDVNPNFAFPYTCGSLAGEPTLETVLESLVGDAQIGESYTIREFLKEFSGQGSDILTDLTNYAACQETARHLRRLFRDGYETLLRVEW